MDWNHLQNPWAFHQDGHRFNGLPLEIVSQIGEDGSSGVLYYFNHFLTWEGPTSEQAAPGTGGWICSVVDSGGANGEVVDVLDSVTYGALRLLTNNADDDMVQLQMNGSPWRYVVGKRLWFFVRFRVQDANDGEVFFGLALEGDTNFLSTFPTDGIFFEKSETATDFDLHARKNGSSTEITAVCGATLVDNTWYELGFVVDIGGNIIPYCNGVKKTSKMIAAGDAKIPDDEDLAVYIGVQTGAAATRYLDLDWLLVAMER